MRERKKKKLIEELRRDVEINERDDTCMFFVIFFLLLSSFCVLSGNCHGVLSFGVTSV